MIFFGLAGEEQRNFVHNAFNVLVNEGFLRDQQGIHTLEIVQKLHGIIKEKPREASFEEVNLETFSPRGVYTFHDQAVITLVYEDSSTNENGNGHP